MSMKEIKAQGKERTQKRRGYSYIPNPENIIMHDKKMQWRRECIDPITAEAYPDALSFEEWLMADKP